MPSTDVLPLTDHFNEDSTLENLNREVIGSDLMDPRDPLIPIYRELTDIKADIRELKRESTVNLRWTVGMIVGSAIGICGFLSAFIMHFIK